ncbi:MAG: hypothetical protein ABIJ57_02685 [Pseudomonadota bacterium]
MTKRRMVWICAVILALFATGVVAEPYLISLSTVKDPSRLQRLLNAIYIDVLELDTAVDELLDDSSTSATWDGQVDTLITELKTDGGTNNTAIANLKLIVDELVADHATFRTAVGDAESLGEEAATDLGTIKTALDYYKLIVDELVADHATFRTAVGDAESLGEEAATDLATIKTALDYYKLVVDEVVADHATIIALEADLKTLLNDIRTELLSDYLVTMPVLAIGSTKPDVSTIAFNYVVNGPMYYKAAVAAGTSLTPTTLVPQDMYSAWALDIGTNGTIDVLACAAQGTGYTPESAAIAALPAVAADHVRMGYLTVISDTGAYTPDTAELDDAALTVSYVDTATFLSGIGSAVSTSPPATLTNTTTSAAPAAMTFTTITSPPATLTNTTTTSPADAPASTTPGTPASAASATKPGTTDRARVTK